jgi:hypothetical protein
MDIGHKAIGMSSESSRNQQTFWSKRKISNKGFSRSLEFLVTDTGARDLKFSGKK